MIFPAGSQAADVDMREGEWETSVEMTMTGGPMSMPPMTSSFRQCITKEDLVPSSEKDKECRTTRLKVTGNKVAWHVICGNSEGDGEITYKGASYKGTVRMKTVEGGESVATLMKLSGRHLGPCAAGSREAASKEREKYKAMAEEAKAQGEKKKAEQAAINKKTEEFIRKNPVPAEEPGACVQKGFESSAECDEKAGKLNFEPGEYELTIEKASRVGTTCTPVEVKKKTLCLILANPVPPDLLDGRKVREVRRGKDRITWKDDSGPRPLVGGIVYRGSAFEGVATESGGAGKGSDFLQIRKVTGRRIGDGDCVSGSGDGRDYTSRKRTEESVGERAKDAIRNPVKGIRNLFGF
ncbi:MAG: DUF3617 domain-containing protein [Deltaproteobacteria bacterium]|nr:DUF3617 domain-containing protein [Deltaproteobacteria bacterium]